MADTTCNDWWPVALAVLRNGGSLREAARRVGRSPSMVSRRRARAAREGVNVGVLPGTQRLKDGSKSEEAHRLRMEEGLSWKDIAERLGYDGPNGFRVVASMASRWAIARQMPPPTLERPQKAA